VLVVIGKPPTALPIVGPVTGVATGIEIGTAVKIAIGTETGIETETATVVVIASATGTEIVTGIEIGIETASTKARGFTTLRTTAAIDTAPTPMKGATVMACLRALVMGGAVKATILNVHTFTGIVTLAFCRFSADAARTVRHIATVFCAATRKVTRTGKATSSEAVFIDSLIFLTPCFGKGVLKRRRYENSGLLFPYWWLGSHCFCLGAASRCHSYPGLAWAFSTKRRQQRMHRCDVRGAE